MDHVHSDSAKCNMDVQGKNVLYGDSVLSSMESQCVNLEQDSPGDKWDQMELLDKHLSHILTWGICSRFP